MVVKLGVLEEAGETSKVVVASVGSTVGLAVSEVTSAFGGDDGEFRLSALGRELLLSSAPLRARSSASRRC
jgi:hypothetical protein